MNLSIVASLDETSARKEEINKKFSLLCEYLKPLGYSGIELSLLKPEKINKGEVEEIMNSYDMNIPALGTGGTYVRLGYSLGHRKKKIRKKAIKRIEEYIDLAVNTQSKVIIGLIRGRYSLKSNSKKEEENIILSLRRCIEMAEEKNVILAFEPINRFEIDSYHTVRASLDLIEQLNSDTIKLLIDSFHIHLEENPNSIWDTLSQNASQITHVHLADCNRKAPGSGHFDFKKLFYTLNKAGYDRFYSLETIMKPSFEDIAEESAEYLSKLIG